MGKVVICQHCHGNGTVQVEVKPGRWETRRCAACGGSGKVDKRLL